jgi:hypothetical protein
MTYQQFFDSELFKYPNTQTQWIFESENFAYPKLAYFLQIFFKKIKWKIKKWTFLYWIDKRGKKGKKKRKLLLLGQLFSIPWASLSCQIIALLERYAPRYSLHNFIMLLSLVSHWTFERSPFKQQHKCLILL